MAFGDSLTAGTISPAPTLLVALEAPLAYPARVQVRLESRYTAQTFRVTNEGRAGERADQALGRFLDVLAAERPEVVLLMEGVNDLNGDGAAAIPTATAALERMIKEARARGVQVMLGTIPGQRPGGQRAYSVHLVEPFNDELRRMAPDEGAILVDVYRQFDIALLGVDGLHPTEAGYDRIGEIFFEAIRLAFERPAAR